MSTEHWLLAVPRSHAPGFGQVGEFLHSLIEHWGFIPSVTSRREGPPGVWFLRGENLYDDTETVRRRIYHRRPKWNVHDDSEALR